MLTDPPVTVLPQPTDSVAISDLPPSSVVSSPGSSSPNPDFIMADPDGPITVASLVFFVFFCVSVALEPSRLSHRSLTSSCCRARLSRSVSTMFRRLSAFVTYRKSSTCFRTCSTPPMALATAWCGPGPTGNGPMLTMSSCSAKTSMAICFVPSTRSPSSRRIQWSSPRSCQPSTTVVRSLTLFAELLPRLRACNSMYRLCLYRFHAY